MPRKFRCPYDEYRRGQRRKKIRRHLVIRAKDKPCTDCGKRYGYWVMQFDHRDPSHKLLNICLASSKPSTSIRKLMAELAKCDVVCANCHAERTYRQRQAGILGKPKIIKAIKDQPLLFQEPQEDNPQESTP